MKKWKDINKETKCDIICLAQGYLGVLVISILCIMYGWNANLENNALIMKKILLPVIKVMDIMEINQQRVIKKWRIRNEV